MNRGRRKRKHHTDSGTSGKMFVIGEFEGRTDIEGFPFIWLPPQGFTSAVDMRSLPNMAQVPSGGGQMLGVFSADSPQDYDSDKYTAITEPLSPQAKMALGNAFDINGGPSFKGDTVAGFIDWALTHHGDPTGQSRWKPRMPKRGHRLNGKQQDTLTVAYDDMPEGTQRLKTLGFWQRQYGLGQSQIDAIQGDNPRESPLEPETLVQENFNKADGVPLGPLQTWTSDAGAANIFVITNNQTQRDPALRDNFDLDTKVERCDAPVSGDDMEVQAVCTNAPINGSLNQLGLTARHSVTDIGTYYYCILVGGTGPKSLDIGKVVSYSFTGLSSSSYTVTAGNVIGFEVVGSDLIGKSNGGTVTTATDTSIVGNLHAGLFGTQPLAATTGRWDDWQVQDIIVGPTGNRRRRLLIGA